jgi:hypothetical protein
MDGSGKGLENKGKRVIYREKLRQQDTGIKREEIKCKGKSKDQENIDTGKMKKNR